MHVPCVDADTSHGKTKLEQKAYSKMLAVHKFLRSIKGHENLEIVLQGLKLFVWLPVRRQGVQRR